MFCHSPKRSSEDQLMAYIKQVRGS